MYNCPDCKEKIDKNTKFCPNCGCNLEINFIINPICPKCKKEFPDGTKFCDDDGANLTTSDKLIPKCVKCGKEYPSDIQFCSDDGGKILPEIEHNIISRMEFDIGKKVNPEKFDKLIDEGYNVTISKYFGFGWAIYKKYIGGFIGFTILNLLVGFGLGLLPVIGQLITVGLGPPLTAGYYFVAYKIKKYDSAEFTDFFMGFKYFLPLFLAGLTSYIFIIIGFILLILPGIYLSVAYIFTTLLIIDKKIEFFQAMETSRKIVTKQWFSMFGLGLSLTIFFIIGLIPLGLGIIITIPVSVCTIAAAYDDIVGVESL